ncbi:MAG: methyltransferase domain-containing protein, partial [Erysipelotrichales bacterium]|nr:methyltransferase domain-containing protein [Erysipelotrichales bacterium]
MSNTFLISSKSFYQINSKQTEVLYQVAYDMAKLNKEDTLLDIYCGIGTIGFIASQYVKEVVGIEVVEQVVKDAENNAKLNNVTNISFYTGEAK